MNKDDQLIHRLALALDGKYDHAEYLAEAIRSEIDARIKARKRECTNVFHTSDVAKLLTGRCPACGETS